MFYPIKQKGGILLDLFLIIVMIAIGATLWFSMEGKSPIKIPQFTTPKKATPQNVSVDLNKKSVHLQNLARRLLIDEGIQESHIIKNYTEEKTKDGVQWLENTLQIRKKKSFDSDHFYKILSEEITKENFFIMQNKKDEKFWTIEIGDNRHVFERIILKEML